GMELVDELTPARGHMAEYLDAPRSPVARTILRFASPDEPLLVWGWKNELHIETGMGRATSDDLIEYAWAAPVPKQGAPLNSYLDLIPDYFKDLYMDDLRRTKPPVIVDVVAPGSFLLTERTLFGYETFPSLASYVQENYILVQDI